jgi:hypothetical protein
MTDETQPDAQPSAEQLAQDFKKDELQTAAQVAGVDVPSSATKADIAEALTQNTQTVPPRVVNQYTRRSGDEPLPGSWVDVVAGEHQGRKGHYFEDVSHAQDGFPDRVHVRTRDADNLVVEVGYDEIRPSAYTGGR